MAFPNIIAGISDIFRFIFEEFQKNPIKWALILGGGGYIIYNIIF